LDRIERSEEVDAAKAHFAKANFLTAFSDFNDKKACFGSCSFDSNSANDE
jgi:hypothetical protein